MSCLSDSLRGPSVNIGTTQRRLAWPLRKDDTHKLNCELSVKYVAAGHLNMTTTPKTQSLHADHQQIHTEHSNAKSNWPQDTLIGALSADNWTHFVAIAEQARDMLVPTANVYNVL